MCLRKNTKNYGKPVLINLPSWLFSLLSFLLFLPKVSGGWGLRRSLSRLDPPLLLTEYLLMIFCCSGPHFVMLPPLFGYKLSKTPWYCSYQWESKFDEPSRPRPHTQQIYHRPLQICFFRNLGQGNQRIIVTTSFSKTAPFSKCFPFTPKPKVSRFSNSFAVFEERFREKKTQFLKRISVKRRFQICKNL